MGPEFIKIGHFKAFISYPEQLSELTCSNCLEKGHRTKHCKNQVVCSICHEKGHKKGDFNCSKQNESQSESMTANKIVCFVCKEQGHKRGDPICKYTTARKINEEEKAKIDDYEEGEIADSEDDRDEAEISESRNNQQREKKKESDKSINNLPNTLSIEKDSEKEPY